MIIDKIRIKCGIRKIQFSITSHYKIRRIEVKVPIRNNLNLRNLRFVPE